jgi:hypothetical protein
MRLACRSGLCYAHVEAWLRDPDHVEAAKFRKAASVARLLVQESRNDTEAPDPRV